MVGQILLHSPLWSGIISAKVTALVLWHAMRFSLHVVESAARPKLMRGLQVQREGSSPLRLGFPLLMLIAIWAPKSI